MARTQATRWLLGWKTTGGVAQRLIRGLGAEKDLRVTAGAVAELAPATAGHCWLTAFAQIGAPQVAFVELDTFTETWVDTIVGNAHQKYAMLVGMSLRQTPQRQPLQRNLRRAYGYLWTHKNLQWQVLCFLSVRCCGDSLAGLDSSLSQLHTSGAPICVEVAGRATGM